MILYKSPISCHRPSKHLLYDRRKIVVTIVTRIECTKYDKRNAQLCSVCIQQIFPIFFPKARWLPGDTLIEMLFSH